MSRGCLCEVTRYHFTAAPAAFCNREQSMRCLHTGPPALPATFDCRRPLLLHTRRQDRRGRDATPRLASQTPHSADVEHAPKKVSMVSLGCPKNTVDGERFTLQRRAQLVVLHSTWWNIVAALRQSLGMLKMSSNICLFVSVLQAERFPGLDMEAGCRGSHIG